jgi:hypothetical protein
VAVGRRMRYTRGHRRAQVLRTSSCRSSPALSLTRVQRLIAQSEGTQVGWKDWLVVATITIIFGGFLFAIFKAIEGRALASSQSGTWTPSDTPTRVMWRWGLGLGLLEVAPAYYAFNGFGTHWYYSATVSWTLWAFFMLAPVVASFTAGLRTGQFGYGWGAGCIVGVLAAVSLAAAELIGFKVTGFGAGIGTDSLADNLRWAAGCISVVTFVGAILSAIGSAVALVVSWLLTKVNTS